MPFVIQGGRRGGRILGAALGLMLLAAGPAHAASAPSNPLNCVPQDTTSQVFAAYGDISQYALAPGGNMEDASEWTVSGGAGIVDGNEPAQIGGGGSSSLHIPAGGSAVSDPMCVDETYPYFRLFARNGGDPKSALKIDVLYLDSNGKVTSTKPYSQRSFGVWAPTGAIFTNVFTLKVIQSNAVDAAPVSFRFTADKGGDWQLDDLYVDPWAKR